MCAHDGAVSLYLLSCSWYMLAMGHAAGAQSWPPTSPATAQMMAEQREDQTSGMVEQLRVGRGR